MVVWYGWRWRWDKGRRGALYLLEDPGNGWPSGRSQNRGMDW